jgi:D-alanine-D-alanine ligase-like ATP-grasp enzyme/poly-gamma-glutamate capsule biosynthesis protein CapA/YwtB (metallophosphatase superfamily)/acylphosphatase
MLSNFPVWLFDCEGRDPKWPTFGLMLVEPEPRKPIGHLIERVGIEDARELWALSKEGADYVRAAAADEAMPGIALTEGALEVSNVDVGETLISRLVGQRLPIGHAREAERMLDPLAESLELEIHTAARTAQAADILHRPVRRRVRRAARTAVNLVKRRQIRARAEVRVSRLLTVEALRAAMAGAAVNAATGTTAGTLGRASWRIGDLTAFYEANIDRIGRYACAPAPAEPSLDGQHANTFPDVEFVGLLPKDGTKGHLLEREALRYGLNSVRFPNGTFLVSDDEGNQLNFKWGRSPIASGVSLSICSYKEATRRLLTHIDAPVPKGRVFSAHQVEKALDYADRIGYPVVCKPVAGLRGIGVVTDIGSRDDLVSALELYEMSQLGNDDFVIEQHVTGSDYRIVVIGGEVVAAVVREPASVVGDGVHTIVDLVEYKNRIRALNPHLRSRRIQFSDAMRYQLAQAGLTFASVPAAGQRVTLANSANLSTGGDSFEVAHELHPSIKETAVRAVEAIPGLGFCGLDMLIDDHRKPIDEQSATVIELNAHAAIGSAQYPMWGTPTPVAKLFFEQCAKAYGIELAESQADQLSVRIVVRGKVTGVSFRRWFRRRAERFGVSGQIENTGRKEVTALLDGSADAVSALVYLAILGPRKSGPTSVTTTHEVPYPGSGFRIVRRQRRRLARILTGPRVLRRASSLVKRLRTKLARRPTPDDLPAAETSEYQVPGITAPGTTVSDKQWRSDQPRPQFDVVLVGDTAFGESYQEHEERRGRGNVLKTHGYTYGFEQLAPLLSAADLVVANLETPLTTQATSPFEGMRPWLHRSDPAPAAEALLSQGIDVVALANNHTADYGEAGLLETLETLEHHGIVAIGAGRDIDHARAPFRARVKLSADDATAETFRLRIFSVFYGGRQFRDELKAYATKDRPGSAELVVSSLATRIRRIKERRPDEFVVVCPHWRRDYRWRSDRQARTAAQLVEAGADLILGHGSHMMQEIEKVAGRWVVHGLGNFVFNSPGRYKKLGAPPYSLVARLTVTHGQVGLKLYPIVTDNRQVGYQPRPVTEEEFDEVSTLLTSRSNVPGAFQKDFHRGRDTYGWCLMAELRPVS